MAVDGKKREVEREKEAIRWRGEETAGAEGKKQQDIGERDSCVGNSSCTAAVERGGWMEVQRLAM